MHLYSCTNLFIQATFAEPPDSVTDTGLWGNEPLTLDSLGSIRAERPGSRPLSCDGLSVVLGRPLGNEDKNRPSWGPPGDAEFKLSFEDLGRCGG